MLVLATVACVAGDGSDRASREHPSGESRAEMARSPEGAPLIVHSESRSTAPVAFALAQRPSVEVGGLEAIPELELRADNPMLTAILLDNGGIAVFDRDRVQWFDARGRRRGISGRPGGGPGEFRSITAGCATIDAGIVVADAELLRLTWVDSAGVITQSIQHRSARGRISCLPDGTVLAASFVHARADLPPGAEPRDRVQVAVLDREGRVLLAWPELRLAREIDPSTQPVVTVTSRAETVVVADGADSEVLVYSADGVLRRVLASDDPVRAITATEREARLSAMAPATLSPAARRERVLRLSRMRWRGAWPSYRHVIPDDRGRIWVEDWRDNPVVASSQRWTVFGSDGCLEGALVLPARIATGGRSARLLDITDDRALILRYDGDGVPSLGVWKFARSRSWRSRCTTDSLPDRRRRTGLHADGSIMTELSAIDDR